MYSSSLPGNTTLEVIEMDPRKKERGRRIPEGDIDKPIPPDAYPVIDNDLARDNLENDIPEADLQDL